MTSLLYMLFKLKLNVKKSIIKYLGYKYLM